MSNDESLSPAIIFRGLKASLWVTLLFGLALWGGVGWRWAGSFAFFSLWSVSNLYLLSATLLGVVRKDRLSRAILRLLGILGLFGILLLFFVKARPSLTAFAFGFHLPYLVVLLKLAGWRLTRESRRRTLS